MRLWRCFVVGMPLACCLPAQPVPRAVSPLRAHDSTAPRRIPDVVRNAPVPQSFSVGRLSAAEARIHRRGPLVQAGVQRAVPRAASANLAVSLSPDGRAILTTSLRSPGAQRLRLHFRDFHAGAGQVWVFGPADQTTVGPYSSDGISGDGEFWAGGVDSDTVTVAYVAPPGSTPARFPFTIDALAHVWPQGVTSFDPAAPCNLDVTCYPAYKTAASAVVQYDFIADDGTGSYICSGAMINTRSSSLKPYLLTAHHCISSDTEAKTIQAYFLYQTSACNGTAPSLSSLPTVLKGTYLAGATIPNGDFSLVLLSDVPGGVTFLNWNTSLDAAAPVIGIHHPRGSYTRIGFGNHGTDVNATIGAETAPADKYYEVNWTTGLTEPGSSGSPLLNADGEIVGTLTGAATPPPGQTVCDSRPFSLYGRFSTAYDAIRPYLEDGAAMAPGQSLVSVAVTPDLVYQQPPDADGFQWTYNVRLAESAGVNSMLTGLKIDSTDYSSQLANLFGTTSLPAFGTLASSPFRSKGLAVPVNSTVEVDGVDAITGRQWQAIGHVSFLGPKVQTPAPVIFAGGLGNAASYTAPVAPGSLMTIFGSNLALGTAMAPTLPLPMQMEGVSVAVNGAPAPVFAVSPGQLIVQVPFETAPGTATVTVTVGGESDTKSVAVVPVAPGVFTSDGVRLFPLASGRRGDVLTLFLTGQGPLSTPMPTGAAPPEAASVAELPLVVQPVKITIGAVPATTLFAGIPHGLAGIAQINFQIPPDAPLGDQPLIVSVGDQNARPVRLTVNP